MRPPKSDDPREVADRRTVIGRDLRAGEMSPTLMVMVLRQNRTPLLIGVRKSTTGLRLDPAERCDEIADEVVPDPKSTAKEAKGPRLADLGV